MNAPIPPFKSLLAFDSAARLGSFSQAAEELSVTQSAISQQLFKLEELIGQKLFVRKGKGVELTAAGELLHETVRETLARLSAGLDRIAPYKNKNSLLIACPPDFAQGWLTPRLDKLALQIPQVEVWVITHRDVREIDRIDVDLVVSRRPIHTADVESAPLLQDYSIAVCGPQLHQRIGKLAFPKVLASAPLLLLESEQQWGGRLVQPDVSALALRRSATMDDPRLVLEACMRNQGIAMLSHALVCQALLEQRVLMLTQVPTVSQARLWLMRTRLTPRTPHANQAFQWLLHEAQRQPE